MISAQEFDHLAGQGHNRIPLYRCVSADLDTPLSAWLKLANGAHTFLLESVEGGARWGRYSIIGLSADFRFHLSGHEVREYHFNQLSDSYRTQDMLTAIQASKYRYPQAKIPALPRFLGGLLGYMGYEIIEHIAPKFAGRAPPDTLHIPDVHMMLAESV